MFRTPVSPAPSEHKVETGDQFLLIGSCFSEHIGSILSDYKFRTLNNPFGVIYNPASIFRLLQKALNEESLDEDYILQNQGIYRHFDFHSDISALDRKELIQRAFQANVSCRESLLSSDWIVITFGTALVYRHKRLKNIVSNCHKLPAADFTREMLTPDDIMKGFISLYEMIKKANQKVRLVVTVSPVRHVKDTLERNSLSKSILRYACEQITQEHKEIDYFPAFEIMMDDLRDYRFYEKDMVHPSEAAIEYIWNVFQQTYFSPDARDFVKEWRKIRNALHHRPFYPESAEHQQFLQKTIQQLRAFEHLVNIEHELKFLEQQLTAGKG